MTTKDANKELEDILEAVRIGGWYDANPNQRESNYLDVDVALQQINSLMISKAEVLGAIGKDEHDGKKSDEPCGLILGTINDCDCNFQYDNAEKKRLRQKLNLKPLMGKS